MQTLYSFSSLSLVISWSYNLFSFFLAEGRRGGGWFMLLVEPDFRLIFDHETFKQKKLKYVLAIMMEHYFIDFISLSSKV